MYTTIYNNPWERATVTFPYVWWDDGFSTEELQKIIDYCEKDGLERAYTIGLDKEKDKEEFIEIVTNSYINRLKIMPNLWNSDWENICSREFNLSEENIKDMKKLYKSDFDQILTGVIGGVGEYFDVDPTVLRIGFVLLLVISGIFPGKRVFSI